MPINDFEINNIGALKYVKCTDVPRIMIIAGPNGVGKSTLLEEIANFLRGTRRGNINVKTTDGPKPVYLPPHRAPSVVNLHKSLPIIGPRRKFRETLGLQSFSISAPGISLPYYITHGLPRSRLYPDFSPYFETRYRLVQLEQDFKDALAELYRKYKEIPKDSMPDIYEPLRDIVKQLLPGLDFDQIVIEGDIFKVYFKNRLGERVEFNYLSSGEKDILAMIFPFVEKKVEKELSKVKDESASLEDLIFLIDSPESYLHPELQIRFLKYIRNLTKNAEEKLQFLIATHSTTIINEAKPEELYVLLFPDQVANNQLVKISSEEDKLHIIQDILGGVGLPALGAGKPVLILEGKSDVEILELLKPEIKNVFTLRYLGGKGNVLNFVKALESVIPELLSKGFKVFAILDKDSGDLIRDDQGIVFTWSIACIENLLLSDYDVIYNALEIAAGKEKLSSLNINSGNDVKKLIIDIIKDPNLTDEFMRHDEKLIQIDYKEIERLNNQEKEEKIIQIYKTKKERLDRKREELKTIIDDEGRALRELDGKVILKCLATKTGINSESLARSIADKMRETNKVPLEVTDVLQRIEKLCEKE